MGKISIVSTHVRRLGGEKVPHQPIKRKYVTGAIVRLKSGGPDMTVKHYDHNGQLVCQWFAGKNLKEGRFDDDSVEVATDLDDHDDR